MTQQARYVTDAAEAGAVDALDFWSSRRATYSTLLPLAEDLFAAAAHSAPASQAYVERVFPLCGLLRPTAGRRNRISHSLEMRAFLKLNRHLC